MALIKLGENTVSPFRGDHAPVRIYHGENKIAGWEEATAVGQSITAKNTYNDAVHVEILGNAMQDGTPSTDNPADIVPASGTLTTSCGEKQSTQQIPPLYGIKNADGTLAARDKLVIDDATKTAWVERNTPVLVLNGTETNIVYNSQSGDYVKFWITGTKCIGYIKPNYVISDRFPTIKSNDTDCVFLSGASPTSIINVAVNTSIIGGNTLDDFKAYLSAQYAAGTPVTIVYALAAPTIEPIDYTAAKTYYPQTMIELTSNLPMDMSVTYKHF